MLPKWRNFAKSGHIEASHHSPGLREYFRRIKASKPQRLGDTRASETSKLAVVTCCYLSMESRISSSSRCYKTFFGGNKDFLKIEKLKKVSLTSRLAQKWEKNVTIFSKTKL